MKKVIVSLCRLLECQFFVSCLPSRINFRVSLLLWFAFISALLPVSAEAVTRSDISTALKTIPLLNEKLTSPIIMALIYDSSDVNSKSEAEEIRSIMGTSYEAPGGDTVTTVMAPVTDLAKLSGAKLGFIARGACTNTVSEAVAARNILTFSTDIECVKAGKTILGVVSNPNIQIYYSKSAAEAAKISFVQAFLMLVRQY